MKLTSAAFAVLLMSSTTAAAQVDCSTIRQYVAQYGRTLAIAWAQKAGFTLSQIQSVRRECFGKVAQK